MLICYSARSSLLHIDLCSLLLTKDSLQFFFLCAQEMHFNICYDLLQIDIFAYSSTSEHIKL